MQAHFSYSTRLFHVWWLPSPGKALDGYAPLAALHRTRRSLVFPVLRFNLIYYALTIVVGIVLLTVMFVQYNISSGDALMGVCIALGNAWGLFLLVCFMGYGLVEIPRSFWWRSNRDIVSNYYRYVAVVSLSVCAYSMGI